MKLNGVDKLDTTNLTSELFSCGMLGKVLYEYPEKESIAQLVPENVLNKDCLIERQCDIEAGLDLLRSWNINEWGKKPESAFDEIQSDYMRLFLGPGHILAPPWESAWCNEERLLFQESTYDVRAWFGAYGLQVQDLYREPDDHIGLELAFVAHLAKLGLEMAEHHEFQRLESLLKDKIRFVGQHLHDWVPNWCKAVNSHAQRDYYRGIAKLVSGTVDALYL